jgi:hypothetical protein
MLSESSAGSHLQIRDTFAVRVKGRRDGSYANHSNSKHEPYMLIFLLRNDLTHHRQRHRFSL